MNSPSFLDKFPVFQNGFSLRRTSEEIFLFCSKLAQKYDLTLDTFLFLKMFNGKMSLREITECTNVKVSQVLELVNFLLSISAISLEDSPTPALHYCVENLSNSYPRLLNFAVTLRCNLKCVHCMVDAKRKSYTHELSTDECISLIHDFHNVGGLILVLTGGEPLFRKDLTVLLNTGSSLGLRTAINTNGTLISEEFLDKVADDLHEIRVSLDGLEDIHDSWRGEKGSFQRVINSIKMIQRYSHILCQITTTVNAQNVHQLFDMYLFLLELGVDRWVFSYPLPAGRMFDNQKTFSDFYAVLPEINKSVDKIVKASFETKLEVKVELDNSFSANVDVGSLPCDWFTMTVLPNGDVCQCSCFLERVYGNVKTKPLSELWSSEERKAFQWCPSDVIDPDCLNCDKFKKTCDVGCRRNSYAFYGNYVSKDPIKCAWMKRERE